MIQISDEARDRLQDLMKENNADGILAIWIGACNGKRPLFRLCRFEEGDEPVTINEIPVLMDEDLADALDEATLVLNGKSLILENVACLCNHDCPHHARRI